MRRAPKLNSNYICPLSNQLARCYKEAEERVAAGLQPLRPGGADRLGEPWTSADPWAIGKRACVQSSGELGERLIAGSEKVLKRIW